jgi:hypothetical protein
VYLHPNEQVLPSSVDWFLQRAVLKGTDGTNRAANSASLPTGGSDDGAYWLELDASYRGGDMSTAVAYVNALYQTYYIDIQFWFFYPYNGAGTAVVSVPSSTSTIALDPMGEHGGDWEHVTYRVELSTGNLLSVYLSEHSGGVRVQPGDLSQYGGSVKVVQGPGGLPKLIVTPGRTIVYSSRHGHASYAGQGQNLTSSISGAGFTFGLLNETAQGQHWDTSTSYQIIGADFLSDQLSAPSWLDYMRRWGPHIVYDRSTLEKIMQAIDPTGVIADYVWGKLPDEFKEENGPTGPKAKGAWTGNE